MIVRVPETMTAVLLTRHGGPDALELRSDVAVPTPSRDEILIRVAAAGINNTDINTRVGWYAKSVTGATNASDAVDEGTAGGWAGEALVFPRIQGADACGRVVAVGSEVDPSRLGQRVIVATMQPSADEPFVTSTLGSEMNGAFAEYLVARSSQSYAVDCDWTDVELASIPCAYSTAENMLHRAQVRAGERVLITGASGGVGSAAVQLAKRRGATVIGVAGDAKAAGVRELGADVVVARGSSVVDAVGAESIDVVVDLVAGPEWAELLDVLKLGGRYIASGAIAGPIVELDIRTLYLKDLTLLGATYQEPVVFENLVGYIEQGEIRPLVHKVYPLAEMAEAQEDFMSKGFIGKLVLTIP